VRCVAPRILDQIAHLVQRERALSPIVCAQRRKNIVNHPPRQQRAQTRLAHWQPRARGLIERRGDCIVQHNFDDLFERNHRSNFYQRRKGFNSGLAPGPLLTVAMWITPRRSSSSPASRSISRVYTRIMSLSGSGSGKPAACRSASSL
jgi:hypothetical protein